MGYKAGLESKASWLNGEKVWIKIQLLSIQLFKLGKLSSVAEFKQFRHLSEYFSFMNSSTQTHRLVSEVSAQCFTHCQLTKCE